ncbi:hypothetical protein [Burkholderia sp. PU8-34]
MTRRASFVLVSMLLFGVTEMAFGENNSDYFEIRSSAGQLRPTPPMVFVIENGRVAYYSRGRDLDITPQSRYMGIGKYTAELDERYRPAIDEIKRVLANHEIPSVRAANVGSVLKYAFDLNGQHYEGSHQYRVADEFNYKLPVFYELAQDLLAHGKAEINLHPDFAVRPVAGGLMVDLVFRNDGTQEVTIDGPEKWSPELRGLALQYVQIGALGESGVAFKVRLIDRYLNDASRRYAQTIGIQPGQAAKVEFVVPYAALTFGANSSAQRIQSGKYRMSGTVSVDIRSPSEMKGRIFTPMDKLPAVELTEP